MLRMRKGWKQALSDPDHQLFKTNLPFSPLKPAELQVLRAQYEKEGDYVGIQTKFNYAWVCLYMLGFEARLWHTRCIETSLQADVFLRGC